LINLFRIKKTYIDIYFSTAKDQLIDTRRLNVDLMVLLIAPFSVRCNGLATRQRPAAVAMRESLDSSIL
jgi:hypothetical protein